MAGLLREARLASLAGLRILDVGCGRGNLLRMFLEYGANPARAFGIDLLAEHVREGRTLSPNLHFVQGNAAQLPFPCNSFDLLFTFTLFTSVLDSRFRSSIAGEVGRVLVPGGKLLFYDFTYDNPANPDVRRIGRSEIRRLFPGWRATGRRVTLAPPLARIVARVSETLYYGLAQVPVLCTHYMCLLEKPGRSLCAERAAGRR